MKSGKQPHILTTSSNLLGICFILITGLKLSHANITTYADEITVFSSIGFMLSCLLSYISLREEGERLSSKLENWADWFFLLGLICLFLAVVLFSTGLL